MTNEEIRIAMAEVDGLKFPYGIQFSKDGRAWDLHASPAFCPNYPEDLNAVHKVEKKLSAREKGDYASRLFSICNVPGANTEQQERDGWFIHIHATAPQRCEAILRTLGKWKE